MEIRRLPDLEPTGFRAAMADWLTGGLVLGSDVVVAADRDAIYVWSRDGSPVARRELACQALALSPDGSMLAAADGDRAFGLTLDLDEQWSLPLPYASAVACSADDCRLALGSWEVGTVAVPPTS